MSIEKIYSVYAVSNFNNRVVYIGFTNNLPRRISEHRLGIACEYTAKYRCKKLVYYENFGAAEPAILREKQLKGWVRRKKNFIIEQFNPNWDDLFTKISS